MKPPRNPPRESGVCIPSGLEFLAKTVETSDGRRQRGIDVLTHCRIVGCVARELTRRFPPAMKKALFPPGSELAAAVHDIGKISPGFQEKIHRALNHPLQLVDQDLDRMIGGHAAVGQAALMDAGRYIPEIVGRHHGSSSLQSGLPDDERYGGASWQEARMKAVSALKKFFQCDWPVVVSDVQADLLSGLTTVADWIGSGDSFQELSEAPRGTNR